MRKIFSKLKHIFNPQIHPVALTTNINSDSMDVQALEKPVDSFIHADDIVGKVKTNPDLKERMLGEMAVYIESFFTRELAFSNHRDITADIRDFYSVLGSNPSLNFTGGSTGDGLLLWLFLIARQINPSTIVESGVWYGRSLYTLSRAVPAASVHAFDITFQNLKYHDPAINYHEHDWSKSDVQSPGTGFCFFDDHINNGRRIREAYEKNFTHMVFDQCAPAGMCHHFRYPGLPSAIMIADKTLREGDILEWVWHDEKIRYRHENSYTYGAENLIDIVRPLPSLGHWIGETPGQAAYVRLRTDSR